MHATAAATDLVELAASRWREEEGDYCDDITCIVVFLPIVKIRKLAVCGMASSAPAAGLDLEAGGGSHSRSSAGAQSSGACSAIGSEATEPEEEEVVVHLSTETQWMSERSEQVPPASSTSSPGDGKLTQRRPSSQDGEHSLGEYSRPDSPSRSTSPSKLKKRSGSPSKRAAAEEAGAAAGAFSILRRLTRDSDDGDDDLEAEADVEARGQASDRSAAERAVEFMRRLSRNSEDGEEAEV